MRGYEALDTELQQIVREQLGLLAFDLEDLHEATQELMTYRRLTGDHRHDPTIAECYRRQGKPARALVSFAASRRVIAATSHWDRS